MPDQPRRTVDAYVDAMADSLAPVARSLRRVIRAAAPDAVESIKWGQPVYDAGGPFAALKGYPRWVTLTFWRGAALSDAGSVLQGDGDRMRHARFSSVDEVEAAPVARLVQEAVQLNRELGDPTKRG